MFTFPFLVFCVSVTHSNYCNILIALSSSLPRSRRNQDVIQIPICILLLQVNSKANSTDGNNWLKKTTASSFCFLLSRVLKPKTTCRYKRQLKAVDLKTTYIMIAVYISPKQFLTPFCRWGDYSMVTQNQERLIILVQIWVCGGSRIIAMGLAPSFLQLRQTRGYRKHLLMCSAFCMDLMVTGQRQCILTKEYVPWLLNRPECQ